MRILMAQVRGWLLMTVLLLVPLLGGILTDIVPGAGSLGPLLVIAVSGIVAAWAGLKLAASRESWVTIAFASVLPLTIGFMIQLWSFVAIAVALATSYALFTFRARTSSEAIDT